MTAPGDATRRRLGARVARARRFIIAVANLGTSSTIRRMPIDKVAQRTPFKDADGRISDRQI
jgi:hypothetical protein